MPQIDKFIFVDQAILVLVFFWTLYFLFSLYILPQIVIDLKISFKLFKQINSSLYLNYQKHLYFINYQINFSELISYFLSGLLGFSFWFFNVSNSISSILNSFLQKNNIN